MAIDSPMLDRPLIVAVKVAWSNINGPDSEATPRGMGVQFTDISEKQRAFLTFVVSEHLLFGEHSTYPI
jgi:Tfp pilus assembly protein PilZ